MRKRPCLPDAQYSPDAQQLCEALYLREALYLTLAHLAATGPHLNDSQPEAHALKLGLTAKT